MDNILPEGQPEDARTKLYFVSRRNSEEIGFAVMSQRMLARYADILGFDVRPATTLEQIAFMAGADMLKSGEGITHIKFGPEQGGLSG